MYQDAALSIIRSFPYEFTLIFRRIFNIFLDSVVYHMHDVLLKLPPRNQRK